MTRVAGLCGIAAFITFNAGWIAGDLAQPAAFSPARDDISDLGALTATHPWLYNQLAANLTGILVVVLAVGLWRSVSRAGGAALAVTGIGLFLDGVFRLDCQGIDKGCVNDSWHAHAHKIESGVTVGASFAALVLLALAFRRRGRGWIPVALAIPAIFAANIAFSALGSGAATRAGTVMLLLAFAYIGYRLVDIVE